MISDAVQLARLHRAVRAFNLGRICGDTFDRILERINGRIWLADLFRYELCDECGRGDVDHTAVKVLGNWFASCRYEPTLDAGGRVVAMHEE